MKIFQRIKNVQGKQYLYKINPYYDREKKKIKQRSRYIAPMKDWKEKEVEGKCLIGRRNICPKLRGSDHLWWTNTQEESCKLTILSIIFFPRFSKVKVVLVVRSHSHKVMTTQSSLVKNPWTFKSLSLFALSFFCQKSVLVFGITESRHPCWCQKHPFMKIAILYFGKAISGLPWTL